MHRLAAFCFVLHLTQVRFPMAWALILSLTVAMSTGTAPAKTSLSPAPGLAPALARKPRIVRVSAEQFQPSPSYDPEAEQQLLALANQARVEAGVPPLQMDQGLTQAARAHAAEMVAEQQLSHQFPGEPSLSERIAAESFGACASSRPAAAALSSRSSRSSRDSTSSRTDL